MESKLYLDLGNMPPIGWFLLTSLIAMLVGKIVDIPLLFNLGAILLGVIVIVMIIAFIKEFFD